MNFEQRFPTEGVHPNGREGGGGVTGQFQISYSPIRQQFLLIFLSNVVG